MLGFYCYTWNGYKLLKLLHENKSYTKKKKNPIQIGNWCNIHVISLRASSDWDWEAPH